MEPLISFAQTAALLVAGIALRFLVAVAGFALILIPIVLVVAAIVGVGRVRDYAMGIARLGNLFWREGLYYAPGHTWVRPEKGGTVRVGLDDLAQRLLPGVHDVRLVEPGTDLRAGDVLAEVRVNGRAARIAAPVDGRVVAINRGIEHDATVLHHDPYRRGWLAKFQPRNEAYRELPTGEASRQWLWNEDTRLIQYLEQELGVAAADGGEYILPAPALLSDRQWEQVTHEFFKA